MTAASLPRSSATPADLSITPRDRRFGRDEARPRWWHGGESLCDRPLQRPVGDLSRGRGLFRRERAPAPRRRRRPARAEIKGFTTQEVIHSREHLAFNRRAADAGYDLSKLEARVHSASN